MVDGAAMALRFAHSQTLASAHVPDEPRHVRDMTHIGSLLLHAHWQGILASTGVAIRVTGVFCHQTPKAAFRHNGAIARPEFGDLLVVHEHVHPYRSRRALLLQAKMAQNGIPSGSLDPVQHDLYTNWPRFQLLGVGPAKRRFLGGDRSLRPNVNGALYALIERAMPTFNPGQRTLPPVWRLQTPDAAQKGGGRDAAVLLTDMVLGKARSGRRTTPDPIPLGRAGQIAPNRPIGQHWSITVQELLDITAAKLLSKRMQERFIRRRGITLGFAWDETISFAQAGGGLAADGPGDKWGDGEGRLPPDLPGEEEPGVSILLIETSGELH